MELKRSAVGPTCPLSGQPLNCHTIFFLIFFFKFLRKKSEGGSFRNYCVPKPLFGNPIYLLPKTYLLAVSLDYYKWYRSQTLDDVSARRLSLEESGHEAVCQQRCWILKGVD